jgi:hypothetical protein
MNATAGSNARGLHQLDFAGSGEVEVRTFVAQARHHRGVRQRLERVVKVDTRQSGFERAVLPAHLLAVHHQQG